ncbi:ABC-2 type transport system permease protein [Ferrimonas sediminum]|uniref:ABC-2 type transport system permease protein n=1 Tax=Ferrimonas sediminum TaxID=718193 RepID=A0A1G8KAD2_9GAMM|nr:ABC transporter permease [Ferrimonas sediminum]SDI40405.1 ABC-2 type transport system permease protein [Ferrimonas sediminum]
MTRSRVVLLHRSFRDLLSDPWQASLMTWLPVLLGIILWGVFARGLPTELPVAWVDMDNTATSRTLGRHLEASPAIALTQFADGRSAQLAMRQGEMFALVQIPAHFGEDLMAGRTPDLAVRYNTQFILVGKRLYSAALASLQGGLADVGSLATLASGVPAEYAEQALSPVKVELKSMFNPDLSYLPFLLPGIMLALFQLLVMATLVNAVGRGRRGLPLRIALLMLWWWLMGGIGLLVMYEGLALPMSGSLWVLWLAMIPLLGAIAGMMLLIALIVDDPVRATSIGGALFAPAFAYMGVSFPVNSMPWVAEIWRVLMPSTHYVPLLLQGGGNHNWSSLWPLFLMSLLLLPVARRYRGVSL